MPIFSQHFILDTTESLTAFNFTNWNCKLRHMSKKMGSVLFLSKRTNFSLLLRYEIQKSNHISILCAFLPYLVHVFASYAYVTTICFCVHQQWWQEQKKAMPELCIKKYHWRLKSFTKKAMAGRNWGQKKSYTAIYR